ncbi:M23 family metallopeptidase [Streptomyces sp. TR02-1]|uniref:M23 family metallopeptidase n=1 Tax=Streptomyces sp. TR02-1 TaxID=3385977 RepID=UPI0039A124F2
MASTRFAPEAGGAPEAYGPARLYGHTGPTTSFPQVVPTGGSTGGSDDTLTGLPPYAEGNAADASDWAYGPEDDGSYGEWNPTAESVRPVRGRHRVAKQRGGMARSGAVLGVGMIAAVGAGGMAGAKERPAAMSVPDLDSLAGSVAGELPDRLAGLVPDGGDENGTATVASPAPLTSVTAVAPDTGADTTTDTDAGDALRARILEQAAQQQSAADATAREEAENAAAQQASQAAADKAEAARKAEEERKRKAAEEAARKAEQERLARLAASYTAPVTSYTLTSGFGAAGSMWTADHTGQDFAAPTGTPVSAVHAGTVKEAGWAGSYGYRIVLELEDGTEVWYCHLSSMNVSVGTQVTTKDVIGNVGATGNTTGPHLHLEVRPGGGDPIDPLAWLRSKGLGI